MHRNYGGLQKLGLVRVFCGRGRLGYKRYLIDRRNAPKMSRTKRTWLLSFLDQMDKVELI
jgi:hypothetical protein